MLKKYLSIIFISLFFYCNIQALTLSDIRNEVRVQIRDNSSDVNNRRLTNTFLTTRINIVQGNIAKQTRCLIARVSTGTTANVVEYRYPNDIIAPIRLAYYIFYSSPNAYKRLEFNTIASLDNTLSNWENNSAGLPTKYYERGDYFGLSPKPSLTYSTTYAIQLDYYKTPDDLSGDTDIPFDGDRLLYTYHQLIIKGVVIMCKEDVNDPIDALKNEYYALLNTMYDEIRNRSDKKDQIVIPSR